MQTNPFSRTSNADNFKKALELFFGCRPKNTFYILFWLIFAKRRMLRFADNIGDTSYQGETQHAELTIDLLNDNIAQDWNRHEVHSRSVVVDFSGVEYLKELYEGYIRRMSEPDTPPPIMGRRGMDPSVAFSILERLDALSDEWYRDNSRYAVSQVMTRLQDQRGGRYPEFVQPQELTSLVCRLLDAKNGSVYNPYAGTCSYAVCLGNDFDFYGQELNQDIQLLATLNIIMNDCEHAVCGHQNSVSSWDSKNVYDYIIATPPFNVPLQQEERVSMECLSNVSPRFAHEHFLFNAAKDCAKKSIGVFPVSICFDRRNSHVEIIRQLLSHDWLDTVILLPSNVFQTTSVASVIIVTNKMKRTHKMVRFVGATASLIESNQRKNILDVDAIMNMVDRDSVGAVYIENDEILHNDCKLFPPFYLNKDLVLEAMGANAVTLENLLVPVTSFADEGTSNKTFSFPVGNYGKPVLEVDARLLQNEKRETQRPYKVVSEDCIIVSRRIKFQAVVLRTNGLKVAVSPNFDIYHVDSKHILPGYLVGELAKDYFETQIKRFADISFFTQLRREDFLSMYLYVPEHIEQQLATTVSESESALKEQRDKMESEYADRMASFIKTQRQRKHAIQQVLGDITPAVENIIDFVSSHESVTKSNIVSRRSGKTMEQYLSTVLSQLNRVVNMVDSFTAKEEYGEAQCVELTQFIRTYCAGRASGDVKFRNDDIDKFYVKIAPSDLTVVLDNLITNAEKHGFVDRKNRHDYEVRLSLEKIQDKIILHVANNGECVSKTIPLDLLFTWGVGQDTGTGCSQAKEILEHFGASIEYSEYSDDPNGFMCDFKIVLPLINEGDND